jgi:hypothetical protein
LQKNFMKSQADSPQGGVGGLPFTGLDVEGIIPGSPRVDEYDRFSLSTG